MSDRSELGANVMATVGVTILVACALLQLIAAILRDPLEIPHAVFYVGMAVGFWGFYQKDPKRAQGGGEFIVTTAVRIINAVNPFGKERRASGGVRVIADTTVEKVPDGPTSTGDPHVP